MEQSWTCVGGTVTYIGSQATVNWIINEPVYSLTAVFTDPINDTPPCTLTVYLNDCDCEGPGDPGTLIITDLYDMDHLHGGNPDLFAIANVIDPSGTYATVVSIPNNDHIFVHDAVILIRGQFNMSQTPLYFYNCTIFMDKGSIIYTPTQGNGSLGLIFDLTSIQGICNNMWQGIRVGAEGKLKIVNQSSLSDAEYGIQANVKMHIFLENSNFFKNYITIFSPPSYSNVIEGNIENCDFDGGQDLVSGRYLLQNYIGQFPVNGQHSAPQSNKVFFCNGIK